MKLPFGLGQVFSGETGERADGGVPPAQVPPREAAPVAAAPAAAAPIAPVPAAAARADAAVLRPARGGRPRHASGPASADSAAAGPAPIHSAAPEAATRAAAGHDLVAAAAVADNAGADQGRGRRPAAVGLLWTDALGSLAVRALQILLVLALAAVAIWGLSQVAIVVIPVLLALIVASATRPLIRALTSRRWPPILAAAAVLGGVVLLLGGAIAVVVMLVRDQWPSLSAHAKEGLDALVAWLSATFGLTIDQTQIDAWIEQLRSFVFTKETGSFAASGLGAGFSAAANFITSLVLFIVVLFFFMKDGPEMWRFALRPASGPRRARLELMGRRAVAVMGGYVRGTVIVALVDAVFIGIGLWIVGVPLAFPLAVVVFICAFIPVVGAALAGVIAALVTLVTNGPVPAAIVVGIVLLVNQLEGNLLQPVVLGRSLKLHELVVLLALTVGTVLGGITGTLLAVPIAAVAWALIQAWTEPIEELEAATLREERTGA